VVTRQHAEDEDRRSPAAADDHDAARVRHPLDPLDAAEIKRAVEILRRERPVTPEARFVSVTLHEPPKDQVPFPAPDGQDPAAAVPRLAFVVLLEPR
jgi:primary-amine oxidase